MLISHFLVECEDNKPNAATEFLKVPKLFKSELFRDPYYDLNQRNRTKEERQNRIEQNPLFYFGKNTNNQTWQKKGQSIYTQKIKCLFTIYIYMPKKMNK